MRRSKAVCRRGTIVPLMAVSVAVMLGFVALAMDVGRLAVARTQCQNAADAAAIAGARTLSTGTAANLATATTNATSAATASSILGVQLQTAEVTTVQHGAYHYDYTHQTFAPVFTNPLPTGDIYNLTQVTITHQVPGTFCNIFGITANTVTATATAAARPRDVVLVLDYSGSMNNESDIWNVESYLGNMINTPNDPDPVVPKFGPYDPTFSSNVNLVCTSTDSRVGGCNISQAVWGMDSTAVMANDYYQNNFGASKSQAFSSAGTTTNAPISGDNYQKANGTWVLTWSDATNASNNFFPSYPNFNGYTQGPGYWGKTFFIWPPQPGATTDWRKLYFKNPDGTPCNDDTALWDSNGNWLNPEDSSGNVNYIINYKAILAWIKQSPNPFPSQLRSGHILFYSAIPSDVPTSNPNSYDYTQANSSITNADQRFWKEYIDYVIGVWKDPYGNTQNPNSPTCSYGPDFTAGSKAIKISGPDYKYQWSYNSFIDPNDNPKRPRHRLWFGPMTMIQYLSDTGLLPGTTHDLSMYAAKMGVNGALLDIQQNHPNDLVSLIMFSRPCYSGDPAGAGQFSVPRVSLTRDYTSLINALWYPPNSSSADVRPWDTNDQHTPRAHGDYCSNTSTDYGLMLAYNQLSGNTALQSAGMGGYGRKGAQKIVILETDGMANQATSATASTSPGAYLSYYNVGTLGTYSASSSSASQSAINVATRICALDTDTGGNGLPGYAHTAGAVQLSCIAFGAIFESTASGSEQASAVSFLASLSSTGGTTFPSSASDPANGYKWCIGTIAQRQAKLQQAFTNILDQTQSIILVPNQ
jgi:Flp pilus assembly protein TadG